MNNKFAIVVALTSKDGMGKDNRLPWHPRRLQLDMQFLKMITTSKYHVDGNRDGSGNNGNLVSFTKALDNIVIMGRQTWDSIPTKFKPMADRINIVITRNRDKFLKDNQRYGDFVLVGSGFDDALCIARASSSNGQIYILGGSLIYGEALAHKDCEAIFMTRLLEGHFDMPCDVFFPTSLIPCNTKEINITKTIYTYLKDLCPKSLFLEDENSIVEGRTDGDQTCENEIKYRINLLLPSKQ